MSRPALLVALTLLLGCDAHVPSQSSAAVPGHPSASHAAGAAASAPLPAASGPLAKDYPPPATPDPPIALHAGGKNAVKGQYGVVTSVEHNASHVGAEVLRKGGNAVDAAVAMAFVLAVTHPSAGNIGGGGFMVIRLNGGETQTVDFRETAPAVVTTEKMMAMLKDDAAIGYRSPGVPGTVAGLALARERFGTRPLAELMAPAIALARKGHKLGARQGMVLGWAWPKLKADPAARAIFGRAGKKPLEQGDLIKQTDLAQTLEAIAKGGEAAFYEGPIAAKIDEAMKKNGGYITADDLRAYKAKIRKPRRFSSRGFTVDTMPPPSMGGVAFADIMLTLERLEAYKAPVDSGLYLHMFVEASKRAYSERRLVGADPDFVQPETQALLAKLLDGAYLATRKPPIDPEHATPSAEVSAPVDVPPESPQTTHFSVVDAAGNAVSCTTTPSAGFGSKIVIPGTGLLLGNALGGFSETGVNAVAPGKRMASSMSPTIVTQNGALALVLGSPGGDTIPNIVAQVFRNLVDYHMTIDEAVAHPRIHHQWMPDKVRVEKGNPPPKAALDDLARRGHTVDLDATPLGDADDILVEPSGTAWAYSDTREGGTAEGLDKPPAAAPSSEKAPK